MRAREIILAQMFDEAKEKGDLNEMFSQNSIQIELLLDIRELLSVKSKRRILVEEVNMSDKERELLNSLEEK